MDEKAGDAGQVRIHCQKGFGDAVRVVERDRPGARDPGVEPRDTLGSQRMRQRLVDDVAPGPGVECLDTQHWKPFTLRAGFTRSDLRPRATPL